jgi:feruloyl esterase
MKTRFLFTLVATCLLLGAFVALVSAQAPAQGTTPPPKPAKGDEAAAKACVDLTSLKLPEATITKAEWVNPVQESPGLTINGVWASPTSAHGKTTVDRAFCRIAASVAPSTTFEVWLPNPKVWNGKFNGVGNGALAGGVNFPAMHDPLVAGYAVGSTDGGHTSPAIVSGDWMQDRPELWDDFGYRAMHQMTRNSKSIVEAYYGQAPKYSYYTGCSGGGQQGLAEVQRYPADYDGAVVGAPANFPTRMWPGETWPSFVTHRSPDNAIPAEKLPIINKAAIAACDANDSAKDGLITDPRKCTFDPATLLCKGADAPDCLTAAQVDSVKLVYAGLKDPTTGEQFWPGYEPGSEADWAGHVGEPFVIPQGYFKAMVFDDPKWDWKTFNFTDPKDFAILYEADARIGPILNATDPDLNAFKELGGKLILWHGWADQNIAPRNSINYYNRVVADQGDEAKTQEFLRLFMVPGMGHCSGGPGTDKFDGLAALDQWVDKGVAPTQIAAAHMTAGKVDRTRPLCPYPQVEQYKGSGDVEDAANYVCAVPK